MQRPDGLLADIINIVDGDNTDPFKMDTAGMILLIDKDPIKRGDPKTAP